MLARARPCCAQVTVPRRAHFLRRRCVRCLCPRVPPAPL